MNTASILIKTDPQLKEKAQKTAEEMGISLTSVINRYLKHFILSKSITFTVKDEIPTQYMIDSLKEAEEDVKKGRVLTFENPGDELAYLDKEIKDERKKQSTHNIHKVI
jgi:addiction module RelB/DinJ family antitoxin